MSLPNIEIHIRKGIWQIYKKQGWPTFFQADTGEGIKRQRSGRWWLCVQKESQPPLVGDAGSPLYASGSSLKTIFSCTTLILISFLHLGQ